MRARNRLALVAAGALCLIATVYVTATRSGAVEARLRALLAEQIRAPCVFDSAEFDFLTGVTVHGLRVLDPEDPLRPPLVDVGEARLDFNLDVMGNGPRITVVHLRRPVVRVTADRNGRPLLLQIAAEVEAGHPPPALPIIRIFDGTVVLDGPPALAPGDSAVLTSIRTDVDSTDGRITIAGGHARSTSLGALAFTLDVSADGRTIGTTVRADEIDARTFREHAHLGAITDALERHNVTGRAVARIALDLVDGIVTRSRVDLQLTDTEATMGLWDAPQRPPPKRFRVRLSDAHVVFEDGRASIDQAVGQVLGAAISLSGSADIGRTLGVGADVEPALDMAVSVKGADVGPELARHFPAHLQRIREAFALVGSTDAELHVQGPLAAPAIDARLEFHDLSAAYAGFADAESGERRGFPWQVDDLRGTVTIGGRRVEFDADGTHGAATVAVHGSHESNEAHEARTHVSVEARDVPLDDALSRAFGDRAADTLGPWRPEGVAARINVTVTEDPAIAGGAVGTDVVVVLDGRASFTPHVLPVPLHDARGTVRILEPVVAGERTSRVEIEEFAATGDGFRIESAAGVVRGTDEDLRLRLAIERLEGPLRDGVLASDALGAGTKRAVRLLAPSGSADIDAQIRVTAGKRGDVVTATLRGAAVQGWQDVPLAVTDLAGTLTYGGDSLVASNVTGAVLGGSPVRVEGRIDRLSEATPQPRFSIHAERLPLDKRLLDGLGVLARQAATVWDEIRPAEDLRADVAAVVRPAGDPAGELTLHLTDLRGGIAVLGLPIVLETGDVTYDRSVVTGTLRATRGAGEIASSGFTYDTSSGNLTSDLSARGLAFPADLVPLLPAETAASIAETLRPALVHVPHVALTWNAAARTLTASGALSLRDARTGDDGGDRGGLHVQTSVELEQCVATFPADAPATIAGKAVLDDTSLDPGLTISEVQGTTAFEGTLGGDSPTFALELENGSGRVLGLLLRDLRLRLSTETGRLHVPEIAANLYGGKLTGRFNRGGERLAYRGAFHVVGMDLAKYATDQQRVETAGTLDGELRFRNPGGPSGALEGSGSAQFSGAELRVPWISAALRAVDDALLGITAIEGNFHAGHVAFDLRGNRALIRDLYFEGPSVPLLLGATLELQDGRGAVELDGDRLDLVVYPRVKLGVLGLDPTGILDRAIGLAQFMVRRLRIEGTTRNPRTRWEVISGDITEEFERRPQPVGEVRRLGPVPW